MDHNETLQEHFTIYHCHVSHGNSVKNKCRCFGFSLSSDVTSVDKMAWKTENFSKKCSLEECFGPRMPLIFFILLYVMEAICFCFQSKFELNLLPFA